MDRIACAFIPRFELAVRARAVPGLFDRIAAVADLAGREPRLLAVTPPAQGRGLHVGQRVSHARALLPALELFAPDPAGLAKAEAEVLLALSRHAPLLDSDGHGGFFLGLQGLQRLVTRESLFAEQVQATLAGLGFGAGVAVASQAFVAWVAASRDHRVQVVAPGAESVLLDAVALTELGLSDKGLELLSLLGISTAGAVLALPPGALARRLGPEGVRIDRLCRQTGLFANPSAANVPAPVETVTLELEGALEGLEPLLFVFKSLLDRLLAQLQTSRRSLAELSITTRLFDRSSVEHTLTPTEPTLDARALMDLLRLWLSSAPFVAQVTCVTLTASRIDTASVRQLELFRQREQKEAEALEKAVARLTAAFGQEALLQPKLMDTLRPEARVRWTGPHLRQPKVPSSSPRLQKGAVPVALRRLEPPERVQWDVGQWLRRSGKSPQRLLRVEGPRKLSGEWWGAPFERSYYWLLTQEGELWLSYRDETDGALYLQAEAD